MWQSPYIQTAIEAGPVMPWGQVQQGAQGMYGWGQNAMANNPLSFGMGFNPAQSQQIAGNYGRSLQGATDRASLGYLRNAAEQNANFQLASEQARSQSGLRKGQYAFGRQRQEGQQQDALLNLILQMAGGIV